MIGVVGSINMDMMISSERIPKKGETVKGESIKYLDGGKGANQAVAIARLKADVAMFGKVGSDDHGKNLIANLKNNKVNVDNIAIENNINSGLAIITIGENDNTIVVVPGANNKVDKNYIDNIKSELIKCELVVLQHEIPQETNEYVIKICKENNIKVVLNPAPASAVSKEIVENVDYITPNEHEMKLIFGDRSVEEVVNEYKGKVLVTLGSRGVAAYVEGKGAVIVPCRSGCKTVDTTGAGDTFNGAFCVALTKGYDMEKALKFANIAAGMSTEKVGAQSGMPELSMVESEM